MTNNMAVTPYYGTLRDMPKGAKLYCKKGASTFECEMQGVDPQGFVVVKALLDVTRATPAAPRLTETTFKTRAKNLFLWAYQRPELFTSAAPWPSCQWFTDLDTPALIKELDKPWELI